MLIIIENRSATLTDCCHTNHSVSADCIVSWNLKRWHLADGGKKQKRVSVSHPSSHSCHTEKLGFIFPLTRNVKYKVFHLLIYMKALLSPPVSSPRLHSNNQSNKHKKYWIHWICKQRYQGKKTMKHSNFPFSVSFPPVCATARAGLQPCMWMLSFMCVLCFSVSNLNVWEFNYVLTSRLCMDFRVIEVHMVVNNIINRIAVVYLCGKWMFLSCDPANRKTVKCGFRWNIFIA